MKIKLRTDKRQRGYDLTGYVRVTEDAELILRELADQTGLSMRYIASEIIIQSRGSVEVEGRGAQSCCARCRNFEEGD